MSGLEYWPQIWDKMLKVELTDISILLYLSATMQKESVLKEELGKIDLMIIIKFIFCIFKKLVTN